MNKSEYIGKKYNRLTIKSDAGFRGKRPAVLCFCSCGNKITTARTFVINGYTKSCGCLQKEIIAKQGKNKKTHGMTGTRFYKIWKGMKTRCNNKNYCEYRYYGGRGIKVCKRWNTFANFKIDMYDSYKDDLSIDRINNDGNYELGNCRWATVQEQNKNKRMKKLTREIIPQIRKDKEIMTYSELAKKYNVTAGTLCEIINRKRNYAFI